MRFISQPSIHNYCVGAAEAPSKVVFESAQSSTLTLSVHGLTKCRYLNGLIDMYRVQYSTESNGTVQTQTKSIQRTDPVLEHNKPTKITVTGLTTYTAYSIQVAVVNMQGDVGPYSDIIVAQTAEASKCMTCSISAQLMIIPLQLLVQWSSQHFLLSSK